MGRSQETYNKKEVRNRKEKKRKEKVEKRQARKDGDKKSLDDMIAYVDENGMLSATPPDPSKKHVIDPDDIQIGVPSKEDLEEEDTLRIGTVTFFNDAKGFGFIKDSQTSESIFVHINNTLDDIKEGSRVSYEIEKGPKGLSALEVKLAN